MKYVFDVGNETGDTQMFMMKVAGRKISGATLADISKQYDTLRGAAFRAGKRGLGDATVRDAIGNPVARVSHNGRVWPLGDYVPGTIPLYDNRA